MRLSLLIDVVTFKLAPKLPPLDGRALSLSVPLIAFDEFPPFSDRSATIGGDDRSNLQVALLGCRPVSFCGLFELLFLVGVYVCSLGACGPRGEERIGRCGVSLPLSLCVI